MSSHREERINEEIRRELTAVIRELKDPRLTEGMVSVLKTVTTKDLSMCKVYVSVLGNELAKKEVSNALISAKGFIRKEISQRVKLRATPEFAFLIDDSLEEGDKILQIMDKLKNEK